MSVPIDPSVLKHVSPREKFKLMKQKQAEVQGIIAATPSASGLLAPRTIVQYQDIEKQYMEYIETYNEDREVPVIAWTKEGFNYNMVNDYIFFRAMFGVGRVEKVLQLGKVIREIACLNVVAGRKDRSLKLSVEEMNKLRNYMYELSQVGQLGRKGKDQAIFGLPEALIISRHVLRTDQDRYLNYLTFHLQIAVLTLLICFTGARPSSLVADARIENPEYLKWKHIQLWREGQDRRGYQIILQITIPHLKGRNRFFSEAKRISKKTLKSFLDPNKQYDVHLDATLMIVALAFRRQVAAYDSFEQWWSGNQALLKIKDEQKEQPVFVNHSYGVSEKTPWSTDAVTHTFARVIRSSGLNRKFQPKGTLYSFRRNFAQQMNDNLSAQPASSLIGHNPYSHTLKKSYAGDFERLDLTTLVHTGEATQASTMSVLLKPHAFHIADIKRYNLTPTEIQCYVLQDETLIALKNKREVYVYEREQKYGKKQKSYWEKEELNILRKFYDQVKRRKRYLTLRALKAKHEKIFGELEEHIQVDQDGNVALDETELLRKYGVPLINSQEELLAEDEAFEKQIPSDIALVEEIGSYQDPKTTDKNSNHYSDTTADVDYDEEFEEHEHGITVETVDPKNNEYLVFEENQMQEYATDDHINPPESSEAAVVAIPGASCVSILQQLRCLDIQNLLRGKDRFYTSRPCMLCEQQGINTSVVYPTLKQLAAHLYMSQASTTWELPASSHRVGMHTNTAVFLREFQPVPTNTAYQCGFLGCDFKNIKETAVKKHLTKHLTEAGVKDKSHEQAIQEMVQVIEDNIGYTMSQNEIQDLIDKREENRAKGRKRRQAARDLKETAALEPSQSKQKKR
ncbi:uncharacterized protein RHIMIDRAFT_315232 [Rhizopus microsporus ATCC 52813]|uniref:Uncharacterized protein n=1 Tax=Rhizopus microsporus ATCC 52813 TaxID=1340429 RepID=A0A2G4SLK4_RHIZD|nr:uncharacterized protein RHIMIDRAFT_315232 [Rhizopus microsporus ATCC 52813]PHZ09658.1 hypothetical protein RHIMIDRAFT_315232 [Rhizopus microsporus ATCC 52813]